MPTASLNGVLSPLSEGGAAAVVCSAGADLDALTDALPEPEDVGSTPVDSGVSPWGMDMLPVTDGVDPTGGKDSTGRVIVTSPSLILTLMGTGIDTGGTLLGMGTGMETGGTLLGTGRDSTGKLIIGSLVGVAEPMMVSYSVENSIEDV